MSQVDEVNEMSKAPAQWPTWQELRDKALEYAGRGLYVFPLNVGSKDTWCKWGTNATTDSKTINDWWTNKKLPYNIGVACGPSGLVLLDIDAKNDVNGFETLGRRLSRSADEVREWLLAQGGVVNRTPSGGWHCYFKAGGHQFKNSASVYGPGVDIKAAGGMGVLPPSYFFCNEHPENTGRYAPLAGSWDSIATVPDWLVGLEAERKMAEEAKRGVCTAAGDAAGSCGPEDSRPVPATEAVLKWATRDLEELPPAVQGDRGHDRLLVAAERLVVGYRLDRETAFNLLMEVYSPRCAPPWDPNDPDDLKEIWHKVDDARATRERGESPRQHPWGYRLAELEEHGAIYGDTFRNYTSKWVQGEDGKPKTVKKARRMPELVAEILGRTGGWPKVIGGSMYHMTLDKKSNLERIDSEHDLFSWLAMTGCSAKFHYGEGFETKIGVLRSLAKHGVTDHYDGMTHGPWYPGRDDLYDLSPTLPPADPEARAFWGLLDFMSPATAADRTLMACFFASGMFYRPGVNKPGFIVDSDTGQGSGKSTVTNVFAQLYDSETVPLNLANLDRDPAAVLKNLVAFSPKGRDKRLALADNVDVKVMRSPTFSDWLTKWELEVRLPYAPAMVTRPNDYTYAVTVNAGQCDADFASRLYPVIVVKPQYSEDWEENVKAYIEKNRLQIWADIRGLLERADNAPEGDERKSWVRKDSRFAKFDATVLRAVCSSKAEFDAACKRIDERMTAANDSVDRGMLVDAAIWDELSRNSSMNMDKDPVDLERPLIILASDLEGVIGDQDLHPECHRMGLHTRSVRGLIKSGYMQNWSRTFARIENAERRKLPVGAAFLLNIDKFPEDGLAEVQIIRRERFECNRVATAYWYAEKETLRMHKPKEPGV